MSRRDLIICAVAALLLCAVVDYLELTEARLRALEERQTIVWRVWSKDHERTDREA